MKKIIAFIVIIAILLSLSGCDPVPTTYHVLYSGNENTSGSIPVDTTEYQSGDVVIVLGNIGGLIRPGYVFAGWNTATDGSGTSYAASDTFNMGSMGVTLYAMWTEQTWIEHTSGYQCAELVYTSIQDAINHLMANNVIVLDTATAQYIVLTVCGAPNSLFYQALIYIDDLNKAFDIGWTAVK